jgi:hypothetical protein
MSEGASFWQEGRRAWERLAPWLRDPPDGGTDGDRALRALTDVGVVRRLLDRVEFEAIRAGRRQGKSWAEIANRLGITRQSAWERWQDVDQPEAPATKRDPRWEVLSSAAEALTRRRASTITVPDVIGLTFRAARRRLHDARLVGVGPDLDAPPLSTVVGSEAVVTDQSPESGAVVPPGSTVTLWFDTGGGSGVREPRRPRPDPKEGRKVRDEVTDETVG